MSRAHADPAAYETGAETARGELELALFGINERQPSRADFARCADMARGMIVEASIYFAATRGPAALSRLLHQIKTGTDTDAEIDELYRACKEIKANGSNKHD